METSEAAISGKAAKTSCKAAVRTKAAICAVTTGSCCSGTVKSCVAKLVIQFLLFRIA